MRTEIRGPREPPAPATGIPRSAGTRVQGAAEETKFRSYDEALEFIQKLREKLTEGETREGPGRHEPYHLPAGLPLLHAREVRTIEGESKEAALQRIGQCVDIGDLMRASSEMRVYRIEPGEIKHLMPKIKDEMARMLAHRHEVLVAGYALAFGVSKEAMAEIADRAYAPAAAMRP